jgi:hypothetical protein
VRQTIQPDNLQRILNAKRVFHPQDFRVQLSSELLAIRVSFAPMSFP